MASQDPRLDLLNFLPLDSNQTQTHLQQHILHGKIGRHTPDINLLHSAFLCISIFFGKKPDSARLVQGDVGWRDPLSFPVILIRWVVIGGVVIVFARAPLSPILSQTFL